MTQTPYIYLHREVRSPWSGRQYAVGPVPESDIEPDFAEALLTANYAVRMLRPPADAVTAKRKPGRQRKETANGDE